jgi:hypothetical protein
VELPEYVPVTVIVPAEAKDVVHVAWEDATVTAEHPVIDVPPTVKLTVPVGLVPLIFAKMETPAPVPGSRVDALSDVVDGVDPAAPAGEDITAPVSTVENTTAETATTAVRRCRSRFMTGCSEVSGIPATTLLSSDETGYQGTLLSPLPNRRYWGE